MDSDAAAAVEAYVTEASTAAASTVLSMVNVGRFGVLELVQMLGCVADPSACAVPMPCCCHVSRACLHDTLTDKGQLRFIIADLRSQGARWKHVAIMPQSCWGLCLMELIQCLHPKVSVQTCRACSTDAQQVCSTKCSPSILLYIQKCRVCRSPCPPPHLFIHTHAYICRDIHHTVLD